ncbi:MAG: hypothetical protein IJ571_08225 [Ruminococcus sp.]|nr:hypothetical protein [Ruminococcus sp.]
MIAILALWIILGIIAFIVILLHFSIRIYVDASKDGIDVKAKYLFFTVYKMNTADKGDIALKEAKPQKKPKKEHEKAAPEEKQQESKTISLDELDKLDEEDNTDDGPVKIKGSSSGDDKAPLKQVKQKLTKEQKQALKEKKKLEKELKKAEKEAAKAEKKQHGSKLDKLKEKYQFFKPFIPPTLKYTRKLLKKIRINKLELELYIAKEDPSESAIFYGKLQPIVFSALSLIGGIFTLKVKKADITCGFFEKKLDFHIKTTVCVRPSSVIAIVFCLGCKLARLFLPGWWRRRRARKKAEKAERKAREQAEKAAAAAVL